MSQGYLWIFQLNASFCIPFYYSDGIDVNSCDLNFIFSFTNKNISWIKYKCFHICRKNLNCEDCFDHLCYCYIFLWISFWMFALDVHWVEQIFEIPIVLAQIHTRLQSFVLQFLFANLFRFNEFVHAFYALCVSLLRHIYNI